MMAIDLSGKPPKVVLAIKLFYLVIGLGIARTAITVFRHVGVRSPFFLIFTKLLIYVGSVLLLHQLSKGKNWAKWSFVAIFAVNIPLTVLPSFGAISHTPVYTLLGFMQIGLYIAGLAFLFHKSSSEWFGGGTGSKEH
jgi:hypothetical protein